MDKVINDIEDSVLAFQKRQADICKLACSQMLRCVKKNLNLRIREILQRTSSVGVGQVAGVGPSESCMFKVQLSGSKALFKQSPSPDHVCRNQVAELPRIESEASEQ